MKKVIPVIIITFIVVIVFALLSAYRNTNKELPVSPNFTVSELCPDGKTVKTETSGDGVNTKITELHFKCPEAPTVIPDTDWGEDPKNK